MVDIITYSIYVLFGGIIIMAISEWSDDQIESYKIITN